MKEHGMVMDADTVSRFRLAVLRIGRRLRQQAAAHITPSQLSALASIEHNGPLSLGELASLENVRPPSISRIVGTLEGEGYIERTVDAGDRRVALVRATPKARRELEKIRTQRDVWLAQRLGALDKADVKLLVAALPAFERLLDVEP